MPAPLASPPDLTVPSPDGATSTGFGHAKVILLGEHAVVYGQPAVAAGIAAGVRCHASPGQGNIRAPAWQMDVQVGDGSMVSQAVERLCERLEISASSLDFWLETEIPARAGLGSSAAMAVAISQAVAARTCAKPADILAAATVAETVFHATPSGIDTAAASRGGVGRFDRATGWQPIPLRQPIDLCVGVSKQVRQTSDLVTGVARLCDRVPVARRLIETLGQVASAGMEALASGDVEALGQEFNLAHGLLCGLGVSTRELDELVRSARAAGALGAKLTGAGGGGAVIALAPDRGEDVLKVWRGMGCYGFLTRVGP
jgi:mevalonate kinase